MKDQFGREVNYLRLSITDNCNLRCIYCMPKDFENNNENNNLTIDEYFETVNTVENTEKVNKTTPDLTINIKNKPSFTLDLQVIDKFYKSYEQCFDFF